MTSIEYRRRRRRLVREMKRESRTPTRRALITIAKSIVIATAAHFVLGILLLDLLLGWALGVDPVVIVMVLALMNLLWVAAVFTTVVVSIVVAIIESHHARQAVTW